MSPRPAGPQIRSGLFDLRREGIICVACLAVLVLFGPGCQDNPDDDFVVITATSITIQEENVWETGNSVYTWNAPGGVVRMILEVDDFGHGDLRVRVFDVSGVEILDKLYLSNDNYYYFNGEYYDVDFTDPGAAGPWTITLGFWEFTGDVHVIFEDLD